MYSIGIIAAAASLDNIMQIDSEVQKHCHVTYLPYSSNEHLLAVYRNNAEHFDALLFGGSYTYHIIKEKIGPISRPHAFFNVADRDYYRVIAQLAIEHPGVDFSRVLFDAPDRSVNFSAVFRRQDAPLILADDDPEVSFHDYWSISLERYQQKWDAHEVDWVVTRYGSMEKELQQRGIPYKLLQPSRETMLDTVFGLLVQLKESSPSVSATSVGLVAFHDPEQNSSEHLEALSECCKNHFGNVFLTYRYGNHLVLTINTQILKEMTLQHTVCPVLAFLKQFSSASISIGWGSADNVIDAHHNASRALKHALKQDFSASYIVTADSFLIGPLQESRFPLPAASFLSSKHPPKSSAGNYTLPRQYSAALADAFGEKKEIILSAQEFAQILGLTTRSAARILTQLERSGTAIGHYKKANAQRGRPIKYYRLDSSAFSDR